MDRTRYILAVSFLVGYAPQLLLWFVIHPWARAWRKLGPARTYLIMAPAMIALGVLIFQSRRYLLGADLGTSWSLIAVSLVLFGISFWLHMQYSRHLSFATMVGVPELSGAEGTGTVLREGIYGIVRHPRYLSACIGGIAFALIANYVGPYILAFAALPTFYLVAVLEERELVERFGEDYRAYQRQVPRLIPRLRKTS